MADKEPNSQAKVWLTAIALMIMHPLTSSQTASNQQQDRRIYQTDSVGNVKYHAPAWTVQPDWRLIETNRYGEKMYHKQQYKVVGGQISPVDSVGNPQAHKVLRLSASLISGKPIRIVNGSPVNHSS